METHLAVENYQYLSVKLVHVYKILRKPDLRRAGLIGSRLLPRKGDCRDPKKIWAANITGGSWCLREFTKLKGNKQKRTLEVFPEKHW